MSKENRKGSLKPLILIPVQLVIDVAVIVLAAIADGKMANPDAVGHPMPALTILAVIVMAVITLIVVVISVIRAVKSRR